MTIPVLNLETLTDAELDRACREWGFFALVGHDVDARLRHTALNQAAGFFDLPHHEKNSIRRSASNPWGYYDAELTKNRRDWKEILDIGPPIKTDGLETAAPQWPQLEGFKTSLSTLQAAMHEVALRLVSRIGAALGSTADLCAPFTEHTSFLRLNYYPLCPDPALADAEFTPDRGELGISHHTDAGAVTVLLQDGTTGLQVYRQGAWHLVPTVPDAFIINIGDIVQVWSNDRYAAPLHRVLASSTSPRISIPYFLNPAYSYDYAPVIKGAPPHYSPINWGKFRQARSAGDYADQGEEIQISHFRRA